jgi:hypothetical protein
MGPFRFPSARSRKRSPPAARRTQSTFVLVRRSPRFRFREWGRHGWWRSGLVRTSHQSDRPSPPTVDTVRRRMVTIT